LRRAFCVAIIGTFFPILLGVVLIWALGYPAYPDGLACGAALAPTSVGIALKLLGDAKKLHSDMGQAIVTAAFIDDIFSLIVLVILVSMAAGEITVWGSIRPFLYSFIFLGTGVYLALKVTPIYIPKLLHSIKHAKGAAFQQRDEAHLIMILTAGVGCGYIGFLIGSE
jgi:Kef-type K+ transport system membrane component KefB